MIAFGPFAVSASAAEAARFAAAIGQTPAADGALPLTYAVTWLLSPESRAAMLDALGDDAAGKAVVHLDQRIEQFAPLFPDQPYAMTLTLGLPDERGVFSVAAQLGTTGDAAAMQLVARLALIDAPRP